MCKFPLVEGIKSQNSKVRSGKTFGVDLLEGCKNQDNDASTTRITILNAEDE